MRVLSGITTSGNGEAHIGNYLGAMKQHIEMQNDNEAFYMLANLHALTLPIEPEVVKENVYKIAAMYLALGLDTNKCTLFVQSLIPAHSELTWLLNNIAYMGEMRRMTQFKDKAQNLQEKSKADMLSTADVKEGTVSFENRELPMDSVSVGLFDYPVLMAADILLYQANSIPVGDDQKQHVELTRNIAERFNNKYGQTFTVPEPFIPEKAARIMGLDNPLKKMGKSHGPANYLGLTDNTETIREKLKRAVTDSDNEVYYDKENKPAISNLLVIFSAVSGKSIDELEKEYRTAGYGRFKADLAEAATTFLAPIQEKYHRIIADKSALDALLREGSVKAAEVANATLANAKQKMGIL